MEKSGTIPVNASMLVAWHKRLLNLVIDIVVVLCIIFIIGVFSGLLALVGYDGLMNWFTEMSGMTDRLFTTAVMVTYLFTMEFFTQRTVGKFITGTMVVLEDGSKPTLKSILTRALCRIIWLEAISFIASVPRGWHDRMSDSYVVDVKKYNAEVKRQTSIHEIGQLQEL